MSEHSPYSEAPFQRHSATSIAAAHSIQPNAGTLRAKVLEHIAGCRAQGATDEEMQEALGMNPSTQRPRRIELVEEYELVFPSGAKRETKSGRKAVVWVLREYADVGEVAAQLVLNKAARKAKQDAEIARKEAKEAAAAAKAAATGREHAPVELAALADDLPPVENTPPPPAPVKAQPAAGPGAGYFQRLREALHKPVHDPFDLGPPRAKAPAADPFVI